MMRKYCFLLLLAGILSCTGEPSPDIPSSPPIGPIQLHPANSHYLYYKGKTFPIVSSGEHYGSVINADFDYKKYLNSLADQGMNYTRIFTGTYFEIGGQSFGIKNNTLAPDSNRVVLPWIRVQSETGKTKYDLTQWNPDYFSRLKDFLKIASEKEIIVEITLFSSIYNDEHWNICPQNPKNNINVTTEFSRQDAQTLNNGNLLGFQELFVRKMVNELKDFDNYFFEIQNEPWADRPEPVYNIVNKEDLNKEDWTYKADFCDLASMDWQEKVAGWITDEEKKTGRKHLIAQNFTNFRASIPIVDSLVSIINFHYAWPDAVVWNYHYNKVIGFDESGFAGPGDQVYRRQAWQFMMSGGGLFNSLDYSFYVGEETGNGENRAPGGGSTTLRKQLHFLRQFLETFPLEKMHPANQLISYSPGLIPYALADDNKVVAIFLRSNGTDLSKLGLKLGKGEYLVHFLNTINGALTSPIEITTDENGILHLDIDIPSGELAVSITKK